MVDYGKELILDLHDCCEERFNRKGIQRFFDELCDLIDMEQCKVTWWDYHWWPMWIIKLMKWNKDDRLYGTTAVQFICTSNITIHVIDNMRHVYLNIFSCKDFDCKGVENFAQSYFNGKVVTLKEIIRK